MPNETRYTSPMYYLWATLFLLVLLSAWSANLLSLPGNWFILSLSAFFSFLYRNEGGYGISLTVIVILALLAVLGEVLEFAAGAAGMARGGSRRGAILAMAGSFLGGLFGAILGIPIPGVGSLFGGLLFAGLGAMAGAIVGEVSLGNTPSKSLEIGTLAFFGRLLGSAAKILIGSVMVGVSVGSAFIP